MAFANFWHATAIFLRRNMLIRAFAAIAATQKYQEPLGRPPKTKNSRNKTSRILDSNCFGKTEIAHFIEISAIIKAFSLAFRFLFFFFLYSARQQAFHMLQIVSTKVTVLQCPCPCPCPCPAKVLLHLHLLRSEVHRWN